jgi:hypothetical protein
VACSTVPAHVLYYGTDKRRVYKVVNANTGQPTRQDITAVTVPTIFPANGYVNCIAVDPLDANKVLVVFSNYSVMSLFYTEDGGTTWTKAGGNLEQNVAGSGNGPSCRWASFMHVTDGTLVFVATSTGLYATNFIDGMNTVWTQQSPNGIGNAVCDMVITRPSDGLVVVATHGNGVYTTNITSVGDAVGTNNINQSIAGAIVYPNPASGNAVAMVSFTSRSSQPALVDVFDAAGKLTMTQNVKTVSTSNMVALQGTATLRNGIYFLRIRQGYESRTLKWVKL